MALQMAVVMTAGVAIGLACGGDSTSNTTSREDASATATPATALGRLTSAYSDAKLDPSSAAWSDLLADPGFETQSVAVVEFVRLKTDAGAKAEYDDYIDVLRSAVIGAGGEMVSVNDTLFPGLEGLEGYSGGVSWVASFPTIRAYINGVLDASVVAAASKRRAAVAEAQVLVGPNLLPDVIKQLGPNSPASDFPSDRVKAKSDAQIVDDLLAIYPSGGADPTKQTLEAMVGFAGFADQPVSYINLYRFNNAAGGGAAALGEYNVKALPMALAHGGRPKVLANVTHHLVGPVAWDRFIFVSWPSLAVFTDLRLDPTYVEAQRDRVMSAEQYGNLITIPRPQRIPAVVLADDIPIAHTPPGGWSGEMPAPVLANCTERLASGAPDLRGTWKAYSIERDGALVTGNPLGEHVERIEQCGNRVVITGGRVVHDMRADGTLEHGVNDIATATLAPIQVAAVFVDGRLDLYPGGVVAGQPALVTRQIVAGGEMLLNYVGFKVMLRKIDG
jgi:uncharacterized protein (DUF1330 family)